MDNNIFSIICTAYNGQKYIEKCIGSVLSQTFENWELIIVDDGSTDNTLNICKKYKSSKVRVFTKSNSGQYDSRIFGIKHSRGQYVVFLDSDDLLVPNALECIYNIIKTEDVDVISYNFRTFSDSNMPLRKDSLIDKKQLLIDNSSILKMFFYKYYLFSLCVSCVKHSVINDAINDEHICPKGKFGEDTLFVFQIMKHAKSALLIQNILYLYRMHSDSISHTKNAELSCHRIFNLNYIYEELDELKIPPHEFENNLNSKLSWPVFTYIYSSAIAYKFKLFRKKCLNIKKMFIIKKYFRSSSLSGRFCKIISVAFKLKLYYFCYLLVKCHEKRTGYYEKNNS